MPHNGWRTEPGRCAKGHDLTLPGAVYERVTGYPMCRACRREWSRAYRKRKKPVRRKKSSGVRAKAIASERMDLDRYFAAMRAEEDAPAYLKTRRMWPDEPEGLRRS